MRPLDFPFTGVIYLHPGRISAHYGIIRAIASTAADVEPPFLVLAKRKAETVKVRIRSRSSETLQA